MTSMVTWTATYMDDWHWIRLDDWIPSSESTPAVAGSLLWFISLSTTQVCRPFRQLI